MNLPYLPTFLLLIICISHVLSFIPTSIPRRMIQSQLQVIHISDPSSSTPSSSFRDRMLRRMIVVDKNKKKMDSTTTSSSGKTTEKKRAQRLVQEVRTLEEFRKVVVDDVQGQFVAVWFYAPWCRSCRATTPGFASLVRHHPETKFVKVPVVEDNTNLHQGLDIPSVPYLHLYHPTLGLVEENKLARKHLPGFHKLLQDYVEGSCSLERSGEWSTETPYAPAAKSRC